MKAIFNGNKVTQILTPINGFELEDCFHKDILIKAIDVPDYVSAGCEIQDDLTWLDAEGVLIPESVEAEEAPAEEPAEAPVEAAAEEPAEAPIEEPAEAAPEAPVE